MKKIWKSTLSFAMAVALGTSGIPGVDFTAATANAATKSTDGAAKNMFGTKQLSKKEKGNYAEGQAIVLYRGTSSKTLKKSAAFGGSDIRVESSCVFKDDKSTSGVQAKSVGGYTVSLVSSKTLSTKALLTTLKNSANVLYAQPNYIRKADSAQGDYSKFQWALNNDGQNNGTKGLDTGISKVDKTKYDNKDEKVIAIIDTGVDYTHDDLKDVIWNNPYQDELKGAHGYDFANGDADPMDDNGHGTHCSGIMAGKGSDNLGVTGIADGSNVKIMALKFLDADGSGDTYAAISAYNYIYKAQSLGVNVVAINNSWGGSLDYEYGDDVLEQVINMVGEKGAVSVCAASNDSADNDEYEDVSPCCLNSDYIISVAASNEKGELADFSNYGAKTVDLAAPGADILSSVSYNNFTPNLYKDADKLCGYYQDFSGSLKEVSREELAKTDFSDPNKIVYAKEDDGAVDSVVTLSSEEYVSAANGNTKSLNWQIKDAKEGDTYTLYLPYNKEESSTPIHQAFALRYASPEMDWERFANELDYWPSAMDVYDGKLVTGSAVAVDDLNYVGGMYVYDTNNYWSQQSYEAAKNAGASVYALQLTVTTDGDYNIFIDDVASSKANVKEEEFGKYAYYNGTSMAAPYVTGSIAVAKSLYPEDTALETKARVISTAKETEGLKGKVASNGTLDVSNFANPSPSVSDAAMKDGVVTVKGAFFGENPTVTVNGAKVELTAKDKESVSFKAATNTSLQVKITTDKGSAEGKYYFSAGEETNAKALTDNVATLDNLVSDGDVAYLVDSMGLVYKYSVDNNAQYFDMNTGNNSTSEEKKLPLISGMAQGEGYDLVTLFGKDKETVVSYELTPLTNVVALGKDLYVVLKLDMGYSTEYTLARYDHLAMKWVSLGAIPKAYQNATDVTLAAYKDSLYMIGGYDTNAQKTLTDVYAFASDKKEWKAVAGLPEGKFAAKAAQTNGQLVVTLGGTGETATKGSGKTFLFDGTNWKSGADLNGVVDAETQEVSVPYTDGMEDSDDLKVNKTAKTATRTIRYYDAAVGNTDEGLVFAGLKIEGVGNTFTYDVASDSYKALGLRYTTTDGENEIAGATVGDNFYIFSGKPYVFDFDLEDLFFSNGKAAKSNQEVTEQNLIGKDIDPQDYLLISTIPVKNTMNEVMQKETYEAGYIDGAGKYAEGAPVVLTAVANDDCFVKALYVNGEKVGNEDYQYSFTMTNADVVASAEFGKYVTFVMLPETQEVYEGGKVAITPFVNPMDADNQSLIWTSEDEKIATVDENGMVTVTNGKVGDVVTITATAADRGKVVGNCKVTIVKKPKTVAVKKVKLTASKTTVKAGKSVTVKASVTPSNATNKSVTWKTSNKKYATVNSKGKVTTKKAGKGHTVTITATSKSNSKIKGTIKIKIK